MTPIRGEENVGGGLPLLFRIAVPVRKLRFVFGVLSCLFLVVAGGGEASAHAIVVGSSLENKPVPAFTETVVDLRLNAATEAGFTQVFLLETGGGERPLKATPGSSPNVIRVDLPALPPGNYVLRYRVLAKDGHLTEDILRFSVNQPQ